MVDLRFFSGSVSSLAVEEDADRVLAVYNLDFLCIDGNLAWMGV